MSTPLNQISKLFFLFFLINISNLHAHNIFNGGCNNHCDAKVKTITNERKLINTNDQKQIDNDNSCLNKSLCRG